MYNKMKAVQEDFLKGWGHRIFFITIYLISFFVIKTYVLPIFSTDYDEVGYQKLEKEATNIAETHDFNTLYQYELNYDSYTKELKLTMYTNTSSATVYLTIENYDTSSESYTITRKIPNEEAKNKLDILFLVIVSFLPTLLIDLILILILSLILGVTWLCNRNHNEDDEIEFPENFEITRRLE